MLRVTCWLSTQIAAREQVHLDSVLMAKHPDCGSHMQRTTPIEQVRNPRIPLASLPYSGHFRVPMCSAWQMGPDARAGLERVVKRKDPTDVEDRARPWSPSSGPEKNYMLALPTVLAPSVSWLACGDRRGVMELLRYVQQIGAVRRHGYGQVLDWVVERVEIDPAEVLQAPDGTARRFLPAEWCETAEAYEMGPVAPPYWHPSMRTRRVRPGVRCTLKPAVMEMVRACR